MAADSFKSPTLTNFATLKKSIGPPVRVPDCKPGIGGYTPTNSGTKVFREGLRNGTPVQPTNNKGDGKDIGRGKVITY